MIRCIDARFRAAAYAAALLAVQTLAAGSSAQAANAPPPDEWAGKIAGQLTLDEKLGLVHGIMALPLLPSTVIPPEAVLGAGYFPGIARLGLPAITETDASLGVAYVAGMRHDGATALPSGLAMAATWNPEMTFAAGAVAGREAWRMGFNVLLGGGVNLARDPRNGRNFEYLGEDPLLAGILAGEAIRGTQAQHVVSTVKHFALNDQETGRMVLNARIAEGAARESDLLAFELAIERGHPGAVICAYNRVNAVYACENEWLLDRILKKDWGYAGWVMSDWGAVHGLDAALRGLDQESGEQLDRSVFFAAPLRAAVESDPAYARRLEDMDRRILRSLEAVGAVDHPPVRAALDLEEGAQASQRAAEQGIVLLRNVKDLLPLTNGVMRIAVIGGHADKGVLSGGGSSQVAPPQGPALIDDLGGEGMLAFMRKVAYMPSAPLHAIRLQAPRADVRFDDGRYPSAAAQLAGRSDVAIVFATQWMSEANDAPDLSLPQGQDELIGAVAAANPRTIVVLETGGPVLMPWLDQVGAVVEAWYPGIRGGEAIAEVLFGQVDPSGRLPVTFPATVSQLPRPLLPGAGSSEETAFDIDYVEGSDVGYRWFAKTKAQPLFPFGYGLAYTRFAHRDLKVSAGASALVSVDVQNSGTRAGADVVQVYLLESPHRVQRRLLGWSRVDLAAGESRRVSMTIDPRLFADWDTASRGWRIDAGVYRIATGASANDLTLTGTLNLKARTLKP